MTAVAAINQDTSRWLTLRQAGALLGVSQATLRGWADRGRIQSFRTPGGHRRFLEADIRALAQARAPHGPDQPLLTFDDRVAGRIRRRLAQTRAPQSAWYRTLAPEDRERLRLFGRQLLSLVMRARTGRRARTLMEARQIGGAYAREGLLRGLRLAEVLEAFVFFRATLDDVLKDLVRHEGAGAEQAVDLWRHSNSTLDAVLLATVAAYDRAAEARPSHATSSG